MEIAKWSFNVDFNMPQTSGIYNFASTRTDNNFSNVQEGTIAPGTYGEFEINIDATGTEADLVYEISLNLIDKPTNLLFYSDSDKKEEILFENDDTIILKDFLTYNDAKVVQSRRIYWDWKYETGTTKEEINENDTEDTEYMSSNKTMKMDITVKAVQVNNYKTAKIKVKDENNEYKEVELRTDQDAKKYYGEEVANYTQGDRIYRIFFVDFYGKYGESGTVYLKADFVNSETPLVDYINYESSNTDILEKMNPQWASNRLNEEWNENEHSVAWLLDSTQWTTYANENANYAIGSPSVEMYIDSYNQSFGENLQCKYVTENAPGYMYSLDGSEYLYWIPGPCINTGKNKMYLTPNRWENEGSCNWWLSSPNADTTAKVCLVGGGSLYLGHGDSTQQTTSIIRANCPIVSLKSTFIPQLK